MANTNQPAAASFIILIMASSTSCATGSSCGTRNIARRAVGFTVARMVLTALFINGDAAWQCGISCQLAESLTQNLRGCLKSLIQGRFG